MLTINPKNRPSALELLKHSIFQHDIQDHASHMGDGDLENTAKELEQFHNKYLASNLGIISTSKNSPNQRISLIT